MTCNSSNADLPRCSWARTDPLLRAYHDEEWVSISTAYAASKAALWSATNGLRMALE